MSHIDTLQVYEEYKAAGLNDAQAKHYTKILEKSFMTKVNELKEDFASQKLITILGGMIVALGIALVAITWNISIDLELLKTNINIQEVKE